MSDKKKIVVVFPGVHYSPDCPLLYYPARFYSQQGYEIFPVDDYGVEGEDGLGRLSEYAREAAEKTERKLAEISWDQYEKAVFLEKSVGTVIGMEVEDRLKKQGIRTGIHHVALTPIQETIPYLNKERCIDYMVTGTKDTFLTDDTLEKTCAREGIFLDQIEGVGHRLEGTKDVKESLKILSHILDKLVCS